MTAPDGQIPKPEMNGTVLAAQMIEQLALLNARLEQFIQVSAELHSMVDTLCGHFDVVHAAMENVKDLTHQGKTKITPADFAECWVAAADEILPEEEEEEENEGDIPVGRR